MKRIVVSVVVLILVTLFAGCGVKDKMEEKAGEALGEKIIEEMTGGNVDIDGDTITVEGEDGEEAVFGETKWPSSSLAKKIPEFKDGKVTSVMNMDQALVIFLEEVAAKDFVDYLDDIKKDYAEEVYEVNSDNAITYSAANSEGVRVQLVYMDETVSITVEEVQE